MLIFCYFFFIYFNIINLCVRTTFCFLILIIYRRDTLIYQRYLLCIDNVRFILVFLTIWLIIICYISVDRKSIKKKKIFFFFLHILQFSLTITFLVKDILMFYFILEISFLPIFYIIIGWGNIADRLVSGYYLIFYTILGSLPLFNNIIFLNKIGLKTFYLLSIYDFRLFKERFFFFFLLIFMVKFPIYGIHLWLLKAHVEAPVIGSILLAGIILKLGGYGIIRFYIIYENINSLLKNFFFFFSLWGGLLISFICLSLNDIKLIVASSSIVHMSYCIRRLIIVNELRLKGSIILMVGHGLCSSGLFYIRNKFYTIFGSRRLRIRKGLLNVRPILTMFWFIMCRSNIGCPPRFNLLAELSLISFILSWSYISLIFIRSIFFFSSCYSLYIYYIYSYNYYIINIKGDYRTDIIGYFISSCHWVPLNLIFIRFFF